MRRNRVKSAQRFNRKKQKTSILQELPKLIEHYRKLCITVDKMLAESPTDRKTLKLVARKEDLENEIAEATGILDSINKTETENKNASSSKSKAERDKDLQPT